MRFTYRSGQRTRESRECEEAGSRTRGARTGTRTSGPAAGRCRLLGGLVLCLLATAPRASARPGDLDTSFRGTGIARTRIQRISSADCLVQQADGKLVAGGASEGELTFTETLVRYRANGRLDRSFGRGGMIITSITSGGESQVRALVQQTDGRLVTAGFRIVLPSPEAFAITRYRANGRLDRSLGGGTGTVTTAFGKGAAANALVQQSDGKLVAAGGSSGGWALARYDADGTLDPSFGEGTGTVTTAFGSGAGANALVQQSDGKLVAAGHSGGGGGVFTLVRYNADGSPDPSFGEGTGTVVTQLIPGLAASDSNTGQASALVQQADGKLVAAGTSTSGLGPVVFQNRIALVRYNADGTLDPTFGAGTGIVITLIGGCTSASALVLQPDGKIVVAGASGPCTVVSEPGARSPNFFTLVRYNVDGTLDQSFGRLGSGAVTVPSGGAASDLVQQADGKLVAAGSRRLHHYDVFTVVRYLD
jgi:uncharacterized delta-60 repeat protein